MEKKYTDEEVMEMYANQFMPTVHKIGRLTTLLAFVIHRRYDSGYRLQYRCLDHQSLRAFYCSWSGKHVYVVPGRKCSEYENSGGNVRAEQSGHGYQYAEGADYYHHRSSY